MAGDDYGRPTDLPWAVVFTDPEAVDIGGTPLGIPLHPVQLYESLVCFGLFFVLVWLARRKKFSTGNHPRVFQPLRWRGISGVLRGDADRGFVLGGLRRRRRRLPC
jgi:phosphatidylglycerol:prolipoprotein diacylglycerol transferase